MNTPHSILLKHHSKKFPHYIASGLFDVLEKTVLRPLPIVISLVITIITGGIIVGVVSLYSYTIQNFNILAAVYVVGYIIGCLFEYLQLLLKQTKQ